MKYIVCNYNKVGEVVGLRGTVFAFSFDRADRHDTYEAAEKALKAAAQFYKKRFYAKTFIKEEAA